MAMSSSPLTSSELEKLSSKAIAAKARAYCVYSKFRVGASLLTSSGEYITGSNVENAAYPVGICAERTALAYAVAHGHRSFRALAVATDISPPASPCGMCRQFIREFCTKDFPVYMYDKDGKVTVMTVEQLLPMSFGPDDLAPPGAPGTM